MFRMCASAGLLFLFTATHPLAYAQAPESPPPSEVSTAPAATPEPPSDGPAAPATIPQGPSEEPTVPVQAAEPPPSVPEPPSAPSPEGLVLVPSFGMNVPLGKMSDGYTQGFHLGVLAGWHLSPRFSLNGGLGLDLMNDSSNARIFTPHEYYLDVALTPLAHFQSGAILLGPQVGWFVNSRSRSGLGGSGLFSGGTRSENFSSGPSAPTLVKHDGQGVLLGVTVGAFAPVGKLALGLVAGGGYRRFVSASCEGTACTDRLGGVAHLDVSLAARWL